MADFGIHIINNTINVGQRLRDFKTYEGFATNIKSGAI